MRTTVTTAALFVLLGGSLNSVSRSPAAPLMRSAARNFLATLDDAQRAKCLFPYEAERVQSWHFIPDPERKGLPYKEMQPHQLRLAEALIASGLSHPGYAKLKTIMSLEHVLFELETARGGRIASLRDPDLYFLSIFGQPGTDGVWGWRIEGHHVSLHFTLAGNSVIATSPAFLGANPHRVRSGPLQGVRALGAEEDLARALLESLRQDQRSQAIIADEAPRDIFSSNARQVGFTDVPEAGIERALLDPEQQALLERLIEAYITNVDGVEAEFRRSRVAAAGDRIRFAWMGSSGRGEPHYYRVHGSTFLIEYDNIQSDANHSHTVWRDYDNDFGRDWLAEHHQTQH